MADPLVHVLVINWNGRDHLEECFRSLLDSDYANARFVLVDNASSDDSVPFVEGRFSSDPRVEIVRLPENRGWSGGNNAGMERALKQDADYVLLLNNDTSTDSDAISRLVGLAESDPTVGALAPKLLLFDDPQIVNSVGLIATTIGAAWDRGIGRIDGPKWDGHVPVAGVCGAGFFIRADALRKAGLLPTDFEIYLDDLDLSLRIWNAGYRIVTCPESVIRHKFSATMGEGTRARRKYYLNTRNRARIVLRNYPARQALPIAWDYTIGEIRAVGRSALRGELWKLWSHVRSWFAALAYVPSAMAERRRRAAAGQGDCRFWRLIQRKPRFFPGVAFPEDGWYPPVSLDEESYAPMARDAQVQHAQGVFNLHQANLYPHLRSLSIRVDQDGKTVAMLNGTERHVTQIEVPEGVLEFHASAIFTAEETGLPYDVGGWVTVNPAPYDKAY